MARTIYPGGAAQRKPSAGPPLRFCPACRQPSINNFDARTLRYWRRPVEWLSPDDYCKMCRERHERAAKHYAGGADGGEEE